MSISLRSTTENDLPFVVKTEREEEKFVTVQSIENHRDYLFDVDVSHLIIENLENPIGYVILTGLKSEDWNIELRRIVVTEKGNGFGRKTLQLVKEIVFEKLKANRLWLDVKFFNKMARKLYESEGFTIDGIWSDELKVEKESEQLVFMSILRSDFLNK